VVNILPARETRAAGRRKESIMGCRWHKGRLNWRGVSLRVESEVVAAVVVVVGVVCRGADGGRERGEEERAR